MKLLTIVMVVGVTLAGAPRSQLVDEIRVYAAEPEVIERVAWAVERFELAGLDLPKAELRLHDSRSACDGAEGVTHLDVHPIRIDICNQHRLIILHELAHAWDRASMTPELHHAFMDLRGIDEWNTKEIPWKDRGIERLALIMVWGLHEVGPADPGKLEAFALLTGTEPTRFGGERSGARLPIELVDDLPHRTGARHHIEVHG
jgi:hypothetical protein